MAFQFIFISGVVKKKKDGFNPVNFYVIIPNLSFAAKLLFEISKGEAVLTFKIAIWKFSKGKTEVQYLDAIS